MPNAFITGGSRGIGSGIARVLARAGYDIAFTYHSAREEAEALGGEIESLGRRCFHAQASLERAEVPEAVTAWAVEALGGIDLMVCNAGLTRHNSLLTLDAAFLDDVYGLNYRSYLLCASVAARDMVARGAAGNIVMIASTRGIRAYPEDCVYGSLKAAVIRATESMALEMAPHGIRVNCVAPGATRVRGDMTPEALSQGFAARIPLGRAGTPEEVGELVRFLASEEARYITGVTVKIDGGLILPGMPER